MTDLDYENELAKNLYAHYGLAVYLSQVLEHGIINYMVMYKAFKNISEKKYKNESDYIKFTDDYFASCFKKTMGSLISELKTFNSVANETMQLLEKCLEQRNKLAHRYFRENVCSHNNTTGQSEMIDELLDMQELFSSTDKILDDAIRPLRIKLGISDEKIEKEMKALETKSK